MDDHRNVTIVTDSTSDIPPDVVERHGIVVVPLSLRFGADVYEDGIDLEPAGFLSMLKSSPELPKTSQPSVAAFEAAFQNAIDLGNDVVCITISAKLSGTYNAARLASEGVEPGRVEIVDSMSTTAQLGLHAIDAARFAGSGASLDEVVARARACIERLHLYAVLQTLDYVHKGGRIGRVQSVIGSAFAIKPVLGIVDGVLAPIERVRTWKRALSRATDLIATIPNITDIVVIHSDNVPDANVTADHLRVTFPDANVTITFAGAVITTYAGPGAVGIAALAAD